MSTEPIPCPFSPRRKEVLDWLSKGKTIDDISLIMSLSRNTVIFYMREMRIAAGASNTPGLVGAAFRNGWLP